MKIKIESKKKYLVELSGDSLLIIDQMLLEVPYKIARPVVDEIENSLKELDTLPKGKAGKKTEA